ncbi:hypothetical protein JYT83_00580 [bacterium AH-315-F18]|nr:hypothetical protein [bacterium AH-315-F18]
MSRYAKRWRLVLSGALLFAVSLLGCSTVPDHVILENRAAVIPISMTPSPTGKKIARLDLSFRTRMKFLPIYSFEQPKIGVMIEEEAKRLGGRSVGNVRIVTEWDVLSWVSLAIMMPNRYVRITGDVYD